MSLCAGAKYDYFEGGVRGSAFVYSELLPETVRGTTYEGLMHISDWYVVLLLLCLWVSSPGIRRCARLLA